MAYALSERVSVFALTPVLVGVFDAVVQLPQLVNGAVVRDTGELYFLFLRNYSNWRTSDAALAARFPKFVGQHMASVYLHNSVQRYYGELIGKA